MVEQAVNPGESVTLIIKYSFIAPAYFLDKELIIDTFFFIMEFIFLESICQTKPSYNTVNSYRVMRNF